MAFVDENGVVSLASDLRTFADATYPANAAIAPAYDSTATYDIGDYCLYSGLLYKCNTVIEEGGEAWDNTHWTQVVLIDEKVSKSGDTMTGDLTMSNISRPVFTLINSGADLTLATDTVRYWSLYNADKNNNLISYLESSLNTEGRVQLSITARKNVNGSNVNNGLYLRVANDGTPTIGLSYPSAWREAIGAVNKAGDTMTGNLTLENAAPGVYAKAIDITDGVAPSENTNQIGFRVTDKNGTNIVLFTDRETTIGQQGAWIAGIRNNVFNSLYLLVDSSGNKVVSVSDQKAWCKALQAFDCNNGTEIPDNSNLNNYTTPGTYFVASAAHSATITNTPTTGSGYKLVVSYKASSSSLLQFAFPNGADNHIGVRYLNSSTWGSWLWIPYSTSMGILDIAHGGTGSTTAADARTALGAVAKAGDTMTGALTIQLSGNPSLMGDNTAADISLTAEAAARTWTWGHRDKNDRYVGYWQSGHSTAGVASTSLYARKYINSANVNHGLVLSIDKAGARTVSFSEAAPWRKALGLGSSTGALPITIAQGGTGSTAVSEITTVSTILTMSSGFTAQEIHYTSWGKVAQLFFYFTNSSALSARGSVVVATLKSGYRPKTEAGGVMLSPIGILSAPNDGHLIIRPVDALPENSNIWVGITYLLA